MKRNDSRRPRGRRRLVTPGDRGRCGDLVVLREMPRWELVSSGVLLSRITAGRDLTIAWNSLP